MFVLQNIMGTAGGIKQGIAGGKVLYWFNGGSGIQGTGGSGIQGTGGCIQN